jgi:hypothetical protein
MKGMIPLPLLAVIAVIALILIVPGILGSLSSLVGNPLSCENAPYDAKCTCGSGERKISVPWLGVPRWDCENLELLLIDPESPTFEDDAISFTKNYLEYYCGSICTDLSCGSTCQGEGGFDSTHPSDESENPCMAAVYGYGVEGERLVNIECVEVEEWYADGNPKSGTCPWRMFFFVESETNNPKAYPFMDNYCTNPERTKLCTTQQQCDYWKSVHPGEDDSWCIGLLPIDVIPYPPTASIFGSNTAPELGSGYPAPI